MALGLDEAAPGSAQARRFVEQERTWANSVARYAEVYRRALEGRGRALPAALGA